MKKTLTVNLNNTVYHIDEDAYESLQEYLNSLRNHFAEEEGADEILSDIEARIAELFKERLRFGMQIITLREVNEIITIMGHPEDFDRDMIDDETSETQFDSENKQYDEKKGTNIEIPINENEIKAKRRLFRDGENRILGGVASGIGCYLNIDPVFIRVLFVILTFFWGTAILIYILLWICIPEARTAAQKPEMKGEPVTIENIKKAVKEEMDKAEVNLSGIERKTDSFFTRLGDLLLCIIRGLLKALFLLVGGCLGFILLIILFSIGVSIFSFLFGNFTVTTYGTTLPPVVMNILTGIEHPKAFLLSLLLVIGIPFYALLRLLLGRMFNWTPQTKITTNVISFIWIISFIDLAIFSAEIIPFLFK